MSKYDEALLLQKVKEAVIIEKIDGHEIRYVLASDVEKAFWAVCWDLRVALEQQAPDKIDAAQKMFRDEYLADISEKVKDQLDIDVLEDV